MNHIATQSNPDQAVESNEKYLVTNGLRFAYDDFGKPGNPPLLLIMGLGTQMISWPDAFCQGLADRAHHVIRFDNRDIGLSEKIKVDKPVSIPKMMLRSRLGLSLNVPLYAE